MIEADQVLQDTKDRGYGSPEIALRDALMVESGLGDPHLKEMQRVKKKGRNLYSVVLTYQFAGA